MAYYREYQQTPYFPNSDEASIYLADLLLEIDAAKNKAEAKALLEKAARSKEKYFADWARRLMATYKL